MGGRYYARLMIFLDVFFSYLYVLITGILQERTAKGSSGPIGAYAGLSDLPETPPI